MDAFKNFGKVTVSIGYNAAATSIVLSTGDGAKLPAAPFNVTWWNATDYGDPTDDPNVEIVRVTNIATDTLTVTRAQESTSASTKNTASKTYKMVAALTAKTLNGEVMPTGVGIAKQYASAEFALTDGATIALDWANGNVQGVTIAGNRTFTFANPIAGARYLLIVKQDATGSRTLTWPTIKWQGGTTPTLTTTANKYDLFAFVYDGTNYYGSASLNY